MKTSRMEGILAMETKKPYKAAVNGTLEDRTDIVLLDVDSKCEGAAFDMEQLIMSAISSLPGESKATKTQMKKEEQKAQDFYDNDSPTEKEVSEQSDALRMLFSMNPSVKMSDLFDVFTLFINAGRVCYAGDQPIYKPVWDTIHREDKARILFGYAAFFANPLEALSRMEQ